MYYIYRVLAKWGVLCFIAVAVFGFTTAWAGCGDGEPDPGEFCDNGPYNGKIPFEGQSCTSTCSLCVGNYRKLGTAGNCIVIGSSDRFGENVCSTTVYNEATSTYDAQYEDGGDINIRYGITQFDCAADDLELYYKADYCHLGQRYTGDTYLAVANGCCANGTYKSKTGTCGTTSSYSCGALPANSTACSDAAPADAINLAYTIGCNTDPCTASCNAGYCLVLK